MNNGSKKVVFIHRRKIEADIVFFGSQFRDHVFTMDVVNFHVIVFLCQFIEQFLKTADRQCVGGSAKYQHTMTGIGEKRNELHGGGIFGQGFYAVFKSFFLFFQGFDMVKFQYFKALFCNIR